MVSGILSKKRLRDLYARKGSILSLLLIVVTGVGCFLALASAWRDLDGACSAYYTEYRLADFYVDIKRIPASEVAALVTLPHVRSVQGRIHAAALLEVEGVREPIAGTVISVPVPRRPILNDLLLKTGQWLSGDQAIEAVLNNAFAEANGLRPGDRIRVLLADRQHDVLIVGTAMSPEFIYLIPSGGALVPDPARFGVLYMPEGFLREAMDLRGAWNQVIGTVYDRREEEIDKAIAEVGAVLDVHGVASTSSVEELPSYRFVADELTGLKVSATTVPTLFLIVAALILHVLLGRMIKQQRTVIGTMKAVGYHSAEVTRHYLGYGLFIGLAGAIPGVLFGRWLQIGMIRLYEDFYTIPGLSAGIHPDMIALSVVLCLGFALMGTWWTARKAARLEPADAMRPPPPEKGGRILLESIPRFWEPLSFRWKLILRTVFRNPFRSGVVIAAATIATSLVLATACMMDGVNELMAYQFERISHQDHTVMMRDPIELRARRELRDLVPTGRIEPQLMVLCRIGGGTASRRIGVSGLEPDSLLYTPLDLQGNHIRIPSRGLILSAKLAEILRVGPGDQVRLQPLVGERREVTAPIVAVVETYLGLSAYAHIDWLAGLIGEEEIANVYLARSLQGGADAGVMESAGSFRPVIGVEERTRALHQMEETFGETTRIMIGMTILFAGLIAFGSVFNSTMVSLSEREREIGTLRVLGYTPAQVTSIFVGEGLLLQGCGIVFGLGAGIGLAWLLTLANSTEMFRLPLVVLPERLVQTSLLMLLFLLMSQVIAYWMVRRFPWLSVLSFKE